MYRGRWLLITLCDDCATEHTVTNEGSELRITSVDLRASPMEWISSATLISPRPHIAYGA